MTDPTPEAVREAKEWAKYSHEASMIPGDAWAASSVRALKRLVQALERAERERDVWHKRVKEFGLNIDAELMDPNGTIWDVAEALKKRAEVAESALKTARAQGRAEAWRQAEDFAWEHMRCSCERTSCPACDYISGLRAKAAEAEAVYKRVNTDSPTEKGDSVNTEAEKGA